jgi:hypothetical protein
MDRYLTFFPVESPEAIPALFFDDQPVESMIYLVEKRERRTHADEDIWGFRVGVN